MPLRMRIGTTIFHNIRGKKLSFSYSPCRESSKVSPKDTFKEIEPELLQS